MFRFLLLLTLLVLAADGNSQSITVSGRCIDDPVFLAFGGTLNGKNYYQGTGTVSGNSGVAVSIYWLGSSDNVWVLDFDGQPYFQNACNVSDPPSTTFSACPWVEVIPGGCIGGSPLSITGSATLPVKLTRFSALQKGSLVELFWATAQEWDNAGFEVQRSADGAQWKTLGFVSGAGNSNSEKSYRFTDPVPLPQANFYRLAIKDNRGAFTYSARVRVDFWAAKRYFLQTLSSGSFQLIVYDNQPVLFTVTDAAGRLLMRRTVSPGMHTLDLSGYSTGVYYLQLSQGGTSVTEKLVKQ